MDRYTLIAMVNLAFVNSALCDYQPAEELILVAPTIAERNLGNGHQAYLWGRYQLAPLWMKQEQ
jgi:hypothetical protein